MALQRACAKACGHELSDLLHLGVLRDFRRSALWPRCVDLVPKLRKELPGVAQAFHVGGIIAQLDQCRCPEPMAQQSGHGAPPSVHDGVVQLLLGRKAVQTAKLNAALFAGS
jgi:hypothetical protein